MGRRSTPHQPDDRKSGLVPYVKPGSTLERPLLPYEKELIRLLGCSEAEYRQHVREVRFKSKARPAGYELIPDIRCEPISTTAILVNLAIGLALTAVAVLLTPKPRAPSAVEDQKRRAGKAIRLASRQGSERFGATSGFDSLADLANYAEPIAVVFARREDDIGGVLAAPQLVWSRAFSYGTEQGVKLMFVIGEQGIGEGINRPDLEGIFIGTTALDSLYANRYAFYWNRNTNVNGRIRAKNFAYGTRATEDAGDPQINDDVFLAPSRSAANDTVFSQSFSPSSNVQFGCYSAVPNGNGYRVNWELVPLPLTQGDTDPEEDDEERLSASIRRRTKIAGDWSPNQHDTDLDTNLRRGQNGVGREYGRRMGMRFLNGASVAPGGPDGHKVLRSVSIGDRATYVIGGNVLPEATYWAPDRGFENDVNVDDINNATIRMREEADDILQVGAIVMIARTVWVVKARALDVWGAGKVGPFEARDTQTIELECIDVFADNAPGNQIGFVSDQVITRGIYTDDQGKGEYEYTTPNSKGLTVGPGYYPLMQVSFGLVRNSRPCATTEFGIKSQVWNRASGLCNFSSLPTPKGMRKSDERGDSLTSGTMNTYFNRTSVFTIWLRPAGRDDNNQEYRWRPITEQFAIQGNRPVDQYNFLRIVHPEVKEYEYKFVPKNGADLTQYSEDDAEFWLLDARIADNKYQGGVLGAPQGFKNYQTEYGTFGLAASGRLVSKGEIEFSPEMSTGVKQNNGVTPIISAPQSVIISEYIPDIDDAQTRATQVAQVGDGWSSLPEGTRYRQSAFFYQAFGQADFDGKTATFTYRHNGLRDNRWLELQYSGVVNARFPDNHPSFPGWRAWSLNGPIRVVASSTGMNRGDVFNCRIPTDPYPTNPRNAGVAGLPNYTSVGVEIQVSATTTGGGPGGRQNAYSFELLGDADKYQVGTTRSRRITLDKGSKSTDIIYSASVIAAPPALQEAFGVERCYDNETVTAVANSTSGNWSRQESVQDVRTVDDDNPYREPGSEIGAEYQVAGLREEREIVGFDSDRIFEENGQITDMSNYTERETSNSSGPEHTIMYVSETIKPVNFEIDYDRLCSCGLAIRSGREMTSVDQVRTWLYSGIEVKRFHPSEAGTTGPSNMLPDLVYHLMTDPTAGLGRFLSEELLDLESFATACTFLKTNKFFFNGSISEPQNLRDYVTTIAPFFILDFAIISGKFSFTTAVPMTPAGEISTAAVPISALFTEGNIIEGSFEVEFLEADQRRDFIAVMRWRDEQVNKFPEEKTVAIRWNEAGSENYPVESFDMTDYCCSEEHAVIAAKYLLSLRRRVTNTVTFKTTPDGLNLAPGQYIKVITQASPYQAANNGIIEADGTLVMSQDLEDNAYPIWYFNWDQDTTVEGSMTVVGGKVIEEELWDTIVTLRYPGISTQIYQVQELTLEEDGLVQVVALEHPTNAAGVSQLGLDLIKGSGNFVRGY